MTPTDAYERARRADVFLDPDLCRVVRVTLSTLKRRRRNGSWPIPLLPSLDRKNRTGKPDVAASIARQTKRK